MEESTAAGQAPETSIGLRDGGSLDLWPDRLAFPAGSYPLADLAWVGLVTDATAPPNPYGQPVPAIGLRLRDGRGAVFSPADPAHAMSFVDAVLARRPDLRPDLLMAAPAPAGYAPAARVTHPSGISDGERALAGISHLSVFFLPLLLPLIVWLVVRESMPYASHQAKQAFFFHLLVGVAGLVVVIPAFIIFGIAMGGATALAAGHNPGVAGAGFVAVAGFFCGFALIFALVIAEIVFAIIAAVQSFQGRPYHYPLLARI